MYRSVKVYGHDLGLSCSFRQWRAKSHCRFIHGYALAVRIEFEAETLDEHGWVIDFGGLRTFKDILVNTFDHTLIIAEDDPQFGDLVRLGDVSSRSPDTRSPVADVIVMAAVGCEAFAKFIFEAAVVWLKDSGHTPRVRVALVEVREHGANSAIYSRDTP